MLNEWIPGYRIFDFLTLLQVYTGISIFERIYQFQWELIGEIDYTLFELTLL